MEFIIAFIFGSVMGSFLGVVIERLPNNRNIFLGRSQCDSCGKKLNWYELVPIVSFIALHGKCLKCKKKIDIRIFVVELLTAILTVGSVFYAAINSLDIFNLIILIAVIYIFLIIFFIDLKHAIIPDVLTILLLIISVIRIYTLEISFLPFILSGIGALLFFSFLFAITRGRGMGLGDVKLSFVLGMILGYPLIIIGLYMAFLTGAIVSIILVLARKKRFKGGVIPFGPFLVLGSILAIFFESWLIKFFTAFF